MTKADAIEELRGEIQMYKESHSDRHGWIADAGVINTIDALELAIKYLRYGRIKKKSNDKMRRGEINVNEVKECDA